MTINEAAIENCKIEIKEGEKNDAVFSSRYGLQQLVERSFKNGVEFAQKWIPVKEELPPFENSPLSETVLVKEIEDGSEIIMLGWYSYLKKGWYMAFTGNPIYPISWRQIEFK